MNMDRSYLWRYAGPGTIERPDLGSVELESTGDNWIVTVYNNEVNTYEEVMTILMIATSCDADEAYMETWEIDHLGRSVVHRGDELDCQKIAVVISTIGIRVEAGPDFV